MNARLFTFFLFAVVLLLTGSAAAQQTKKPATVPIAKFKPPAVKTYLGKFSGVTGTCSAAEGVQVIALPLSIVDDKNNSYSISSYQFAYTRAGVTEDEETGKLSPETDMVGKRFEETPLPEIWKSNITEQLHTGEELHFFDIIVKDKQGRRFFAPELKIRIQ